MVQEFKISTKIKFPPKPLKLMPKNLNELTIESITTFKFFFYLKRLKFHLYKIDQILTI